jgi:hypothetical protein
MLKFVHRFRPQEVGANPYIAFTGSDFGTALETLTSLDVGITSDGVLF